MPGLKKPLIEDSHQVCETFVTSVVDAALISNSAVSVTLGMRRHQRLRYGDDPEEVVVITSRIVLTLDAAKNLVEAVAMMLAQANRPEKSLDKSGLS
jgi:hypothetical protein